MVEVSQEITDAWGKIRENNDESKHMIITFEGKEAKLECLSEEGYEEFIQHFTEDKICVGVMRITGKDEYSTRTYFAFISHAGKAAKPLQRAKFGLMSQGIQKHFTVHANIQGSAPEDYNKDVIIAHLQKNSGAHKCKEYVF